MAKEKIVLPTIKDDEKTREDWAEWHAKQLLEDLKRRKFVR